MRIFLAGIMQGSHEGPRLHDQTYRDTVKTLLAAHLPEADVYDPLAEHQSSIDYDDATGREVFFGHNEMCREVDVLVAFAPEASMGTAIEMWEAYRHGAIVITVSPMRHNWAIRFLSHVVYEDMPTFRQAVSSGELAKLVVPAGSGGTPCSCTRKSADDQL